MPKTNTTAAAGSDDGLMLEIFERLALAAGREVMRVFHEGCAVDRKSDSSPVTEADRESEKIILAGLRTAFPDIPCVAEEEASAGVVPPDLALTPSAAEVVRQLIVDDDVPGRGHRKALFAAEMRYAGIACGPHRTYRVMWVADLGRTPDGRP